MHHKLTSWGANLPLLMIYFMKIDDLFINGKLWAYILVDWAASGDHHRDQLFLSSLPQR